MKESLHIVCPHCNITNRVKSTRLFEEPKCGKCKQKLFNAHPIELTSSNFQKHAMHNEIPMVVDFWAPWCGPCKMMAPIFEQAASQLEPWIRFGKLNTEHETTIASQYGIQSIPTIMIFKGGKEIGRQVGAMDITNLVRWVQSHT